MNGRYSRPWDRVSVTIDVVDDGRLLVPHGVETEIVEYDSMTGITGYRLTGRRDLILEALLLYCNGDEEQARWHLLQDGQEVES